MQTEITVPLSEDIFNSLWKTRRLGDLKGEAPLKNVGYNFIWFRGSQGCWVLEPILGCVIAGREGKSAGSEGEGPLKGNGHSRTTRRNQLTTIWRQFWKSEEAKGALIWRQVLGCSISRNSLPKESKICSLSWQTKTLQPCFYSTISTSALSHESVPWTERLFMEAQSVELSTQVHDQRELG